MNSAKYWKIFSAILLIIILYLQFCGKRGIEPDIKAQSDSLVRVVQQRDARIKADSILYENRKAALLADRQEKIARLNASEILLYQSQGKINTLVAQLRAAKSLPFDSSFIYVAPEYVTACDSLSVVAESQGKQLTEVKQDKDDLIDLMNYEVVLRDSMLEAQRARYAELRNDFNAQTHFFQLAIKSGKPKTKVYAGMSVLGNIQMPVKGGEVSFTLMTKKEQQFELGTGFNSMKVDLPNNEKKTVNDWYGRVGYKFKIKF